MGARAGARAAEQVVWWGVRRGVQNLCVEIETVRVERAGRDGAERCRWDEIRYESRESVEERIESRAGRSHV